MRKLLWLVVVVGVVTVGLWLLSSRSEAQGPPWYDVSGRLTFGTSGVSNHVIQARPESSNDWSDATTTNGSGYYAWHPSGWNRGYIWMRAKNGCGFQGDGVWAADSGKWYYDPAGSGTYTQNLTAQDCFGDGPKGP
jgi:hypothetical protein